MDEFGKIGGKGYHIRFVRIDMLIRFDERIFDGIFDPRLYVIYVQSGINVAR